MLIFALSFHFVLLFFCPQFFMLLPLMICQSLESFISSAACLARVWASSGIPLLFLDAPIPEYPAGLAPSVHSELVNFAAIKRFGIHYLLIFAAIKRFGITMSAGIIADSGTNLSKKFFLALLSINIAWGGARIHRRWSSLFRWWSVSACTGFIFWSGPDHLYGILLTF